MAFEGGVLQGDLSEDFASDKLGDHDADIYGAISLTKQISPDIDWRLSGAYHFGSERDFGFDVDVEGGTFDFSMGDEFDFQTIDFDIGKHFNAGAADIRIFGGLRALHVSEDANIGFSATPTDPTDKSGSVDKVGSSEFYGIGPRVGASGYYALGQNWGLSGSIAGAAIWGRRDIDVNMTAVSNDPGDPDPQPEVQELNFSQSSTEVIGNVELTAGVTFMPWENTAFTAGYRVDHWDSLLSGAFSGEDEDQTFHGPFLRLEVKM